MKKLSESLDWDDRLKTALGAYDGEISDPEILKEGLLTLKSHLINMLEYKPTEHLVSGQIHLIRPTGASQYDNCGLVQVRTIVLKVFVCNFLCFSIVNKLRRLRLSVVTI